MDHGTFLCAIFVAGPRVMHFLDHDPDKSTLLKGVPQQLMRKEEVGA
jgi:hypothetical protein